MERLRERDKEKQIDRERENEHEGCYRRKMRRRRWHGGKKGGEGGDCLAKEPLTTYDHVIN